MSNSPIPRKAHLARGIARDQHRIRRLEIDGHAGLIVPGVAGYQYSWTGLTPAATFTPSLSGLFVNGAPDSIGCTLESDSLRIPPGWMWWASLVLKVKTSAAPPTGEFLMWSVLNRFGYGSVRADPMPDSSTTAQRFGATVIGSSGIDYDGVYLPTFTASLGTVFVPTQLDIYVTALSPIPLGFTGVIS